MGRCIIASSSTFTLSRFSRKPTSILPSEIPRFSFSRSLTANSRPLKHEFHRTLPPAFSCGRGLCARAVLSDVSEEKQYFKVGAESTGSIPSDRLLDVIETAAKTGAQVIMDAVNKPRNVTYKGLTDLVTDTDKMSEAAILDVVKKNFQDHLILGEEGGIIGDSSSDYLWCIDPLDGTTNFAHCYPSFAVSIGVLYKGKPAAAAVVEFVGGPKCWNTRTFTAAAGKGAFCNGEKIHVSQTDKIERSLLVTGFGYEHDDPWATNMELFKQFTDVSRGVRRLGAAAVDMSHVALGIVEAYWEYRLKPWDMAAGVLIVEEAGGTVSCMDGGKFSVFDRSVLVSNGVLHSKLLERIGPATEKLKDKGIDFSLWYKPENYYTEL
ncbi:myo-inositol monophosphatase like 1 [Perilla frutescens var. hirtella]|uniref:Inositol-1-monophosphatase n=1 Tax=Perilla frutescens var. hirtella TaxID=608512 RepID=A0AAD4IQ80_PERFH|nr:myo-inositol monophosphatase like 1 [Perilla frutescens var. hirtella]KAH6764840.1 myo-inositol monophosphatase like 1 [Perilla frutescens var. frutescens]KAH6776266.1 myo-inositol monophosphatase like 1 [Perilla frutescens var. hirtella]